MQHRVRSTVCAFAAAALITTATSIPLAAPAGASATACSSGRTTYCAYINGSGLKVNYLIGSFSSASTVCNWTITAEFFDANGRWYKTFESKKHLGCWLTNRDQLNIKYTAKAGKVYSTLRSNGSRVTSVSFSIHR